MKRIITAGALALMLGLAACFHSELDACLAVPTYDCLIDQAAKTAGRADDPAQRTYILAYTARIMVEAGDAASAGPLLDEAVEWLDRIEDQARREPVLPIIVRANALLGRLDAAQAYLAEIDRPYGMGLALAWLAQVHASRGEREKAVQAIERIPPLLDRMKPERTGIVAGWAAIAEAAAGRRDMALAVAEMGHGLATSHSEQVLRVIGLALAAVAMQDAGDYGRARSYLAEAAEAGRALEQKGAPANERGSATAFLVWAQIRLGETGAARADADRLLKLVSEERMPYRRAMLLGVAALALAGAER